MVFHLGKDLTSLAIEGETGTNLGGGTIKEKETQLLLIQQNLIECLLRTRNCSHKDISAFAGLTFRPAEKMRAVDRDDRHINQVYSVRQCRQRGKGN